MDTPPPISGTMPAALKGTDKLWAVLSHLSMFLGVAFLLPLVVWLVMRRESEYVAANAREALNFHLSLVIYSLCCLPLLFLFLIGLVPLAAIGIVAFILSIVAAVRASDGECYHYPLTLRLIH